MDINTLLTFLTLVIGFYMAWNIGANDVSNAMGTSVGSGALTLRRAVILAALLEFSGAYFVGAHVSETMQHGLIDSFYPPDVPTKADDGAYDCVCGRHWPAEKGGHL